MEKKLEYIKSLVDGYKFVSFDIFDTLMFRTIPHYTDLYNLIKQKYVETYGTLDSDFKKQRIPAEARARKSVYPKEVTLDYIYSFLPYSKEVRDHLKKIEIDCEIKCCLPNKPMIAFLNWCKEQHKTIVIITDMYHDRKTINAILSKIGVSYDRLYISCEAGVTKRTGDLFCVVLKDLNIEPTELVHTGDDANNDIAKPLAAGINAFERITDVLFDRIPSKKCEIEKHVLSIYETHVTTDERADDLRRFAYCVLGPMCIDFCQWVHRQAQYHSVDSILFVAREGFLLKQCYETLYPDEINKVKYVRLNKNLLRLPLLKFENPVEEFLRSVPSRIMMTWDEVLKNFIIDDIELFKKTIAEKFVDIEIKKPFMQNSFLSDTVERKVLAFIIECQKENIDIQYNLLDQYLTDIGVYGQKVCLVNNSLNGSGQSMIEQYAKKNHRQCNIIGMQFVKSKVCAERLLDRCAAWITDSHLPSSYTYYYGSGNLILEHLMFESMGTALHFVSDKNGIDVVCEDQRSEVNNNELIRMLHYFTMDFVELYRDNLNLSLNYVGAHLFKRWLERPDQNTARLFCNLFDDDNDGDKKLADLSIVELRYIALKRFIPDRIKWYPGYFSARGCLRIWSWLYNFRYTLKYKLKKF